MEPTTPFRYRLLVSFKDPDGYHFVSHDLNQGTTHAEAVRTALAIHAVRRASTTRVELLELVAAEIIERPEPEWVKSGQDRLNEALRAEISDLEGKLAEALAAT